MEQLAFEEVDYWPELVEIMSGAKRQLLLLFTFAGAQAGLYYHFGVDKVPFEKLFGIYKQDIEHQFRLFRRL